MSKLKLGDKVRSLSPHHNKNVFEVVFIKGDEVTAFYEAADERRSYRIITKHERLVKI